MRLQRRKEFLHSDFAGLKTVNFGLLRARMAQEDSGEHIRQGPKDWKRIDNYRLTNEIRIWL